ncbi:hypothetical protein [Corynebacterium tuberculostearicum]|uniref:hypothetical protein n=1 Tax=Corynebacterium tuberculostearicum TaxID=38304 RepID=UPI00254A40CF|nr:hypothetical protein [Corynebacterium tuberculostearicum]MDK8678227.1 hypothetical protein [Corynebacterium tuberculostearicum]
MTAWQPGMFIMHGMVYEHDGKHYRARYGHTALPEYPPDKTPDLFDPIDSTPVGSSHT